MQTSGEEEEVEEVIPELTEEQKLQNKIKELEEQIKAKSKPIEVEVPKEVKKKKRFWGKAKKYGDDLEKGIKDLDID